MSPIIHCYMIIKICITDDHPLAIKGLENMLAAFDHIQVLSSYSSGEKLLKGLETEQPDVLLLDVLLADIHGEELAKRVHSLYPYINILAISSLDAPAHVKNMLKNGCKGYVLKNIEQDTLVTAIETVYKGEEFLDDVIKDKWAKYLLKYKRMIPEKKAPLTRRETEVLRLIAKEYSNQEIAKALFLSIRTVENHRFNIQQKLEIKNTAGLINSAIQMGLLED